MGGCVGKIQQWFACHDARAVRSVEMVDRATVPRASATVGVASEDLSIEESPTRVVSYFLIFLINECLHSRLIDLAIFIFHLLF